MKNTKSKLIGFTIAAVLGLILFANQITRVSYSYITNSSDKNKVMSARASIASTSGQTNEVLLQDNFDRANASSLGAPWIEGNEVTSDFICSTGDPVGPGFVELNNGTLTFHYRNHSQKPSFPFTSGNGQPLLFAPLAHSVTSFPVTCSFTFTPHQDERTFHEVGLMSAVESFDIHEGCHRFSTPKNSIGLLLVRTASAVNNSFVQIFKYEGGNRTVLAEKNTAFQFSFGTVYTVQFTVNQDFSATVQVSNGSNTDQVSSNSTSFTFLLDQFFITDFQGQISSNTTGPGEFLLRFDDVLVNSGCAPAPAGLVSWWLGEGNANDISGGNNGTLQNGAAIVTGKVGQAFSFDGVDDYISIPDSPSLRLSNLTIEGWFNFATIDGTRILFGKTAGLGTSESYVVYYAAGTLWATIGDTSSIGDQLSYIWAPTLGTWYHIGYTFDSASGAQSLYVNGIRVASGTTAKRIGYDAHPVVIGAEFENENLVTFYKGLVDEVSLYNRPLSTLEIQTIYNAGSAGKCKTRSLTEAAVDLARTVIGAEYLFGGKGWDWNGSRFVRTDQINLGYNYCRIYDKCGQTLITNSCEIIFDKGLDCSGLIFWSYNKAQGATKYQSKANPVFYEGADGQYRNNSTGVNESDLKLGDLLFFDFNHDGRIDHVAMYIGGNNVNDVIEASDCNSGVKLSSKDSLKRNNGFVGFRRITTPVVEFQVRSHSPIDLVVIDPDGFTISVQTFIVTDREILHEIPKALYYSEWDIDGDGSLDALVSAPTVKPGAYLIKVVPKAGVSSTDTYGLDVEASGQTITLAQNVSIGDIPSQGYGLKSTGGQIVIFTPVAVDIKPGSFPNTINLRSNGVIPVAILSTHTFNATTVDPLSVRFGPSGARESHNRGHIEDINSDGLPDLVLHFDVRQTGIATGDMQAVLEGRIFGGQLIRGTDSIRVVP